MQSHEKSLEPEEIIQAWGHLGRLPGGGERFIYPDAGILERKECAGSQSQEQLFVVGRSLLASPETLDKATRRDCTGRAEGYLASDGGQGQAQGTQAYPGLMFPPVHVGLGRGSPHQGPTSGLAEISRAQKA